MYHVATLQDFASDGTVYRAYDHAVIAAAGIVAAVPLIQTEGVLTGLSDCSPVPWRALWTMLTVDADHQAVFDRDLSVPEIIYTLGLTDTVLGAATLPEYRSVVFIHPETGLRLGISSDYVVKASKANQ